jgi:hypothetical protein
MVVAGVPLGALASHMAPGRCSGLQVPTRLAALWSCRGEAATAAGMVWCLGMLMDMQASLPFTMCPFRQRKLLPA